VTGGAGEDVVVADNGSASVSLAGVLATIQSSDASVAGSYNDVIEAGKGFDVVIGGNGTDTIHAGGGSANDVVAGDNGSAVFTAAGVLVHIQTKDPANGGADVI